MTTNHNIIRLLEMLDNPETYSEQDIHAIIDSDEETHEAYQLMVAAKQGYIHRQSKQPIDIQAAWQRLEAKLESTHTKSDTTPSELHTTRSSRNWQKMAATFIGILFISGIAFAAIHIWHLTPTPSPKDDGNGYTSTVDTTIHRTPLSSQRGTENAQSPVTYDNIPLEKMLPEIASHYDVTVSFANDNARQLRFRFVWNPQQSIDQVVSDLNQFERLKVTINDNQITVE